MLLLQLPGEEQKNSFPDRVAVCSVCPGDGQEFGFVSDKASAKYYISNSVRTKQCIVILYFPCAKSEQSYSENTILNPP